MSLILNKKNLDVYICLIVIIVSTLVAIKTYVNIQTTQESLAINIPFSTAPQTAYGFYTQDNQCFGFLKTEKTFAIDLKVGVAGKLRVTINKQPEIFDISAGFVINSLGQVAYGNIIIKKAADELFSLAAKNVNPIEITASFPRESTLKYSLPGPMLFKKTSPEFYSITVPSSPFSPAQQQMLTTSKQNYSTLLAGITLLERNKLPTECTSDKGISLDISEYFVRIQKLIETQLSLTLQDK